MVENEKLNWATLPEELQDEIKFVITIHEKVKEKTKEKEMPPKDQPAYVPEID